MRVRTGHSGLVVTLSLANEACEATYRLSESDAESVVAGLLMELSQMNPVRWTGICEQVREVRRLPLDRRGMRGQWTAPQHEAMGIIFADGWASPCGHPAPCCYTADAEGVVHCAECKITITLAELKGNAGG